MKVPKILVGCPTHERYAYCFDQYLESVKSIDYPNFDILLVDNSKSDDFFNKVKSKGVPILKGKFFEDAKERIVDSRNILRQEVLDKGYDYFLSLEQDVIPPRNVIQKLLSHGKEVVSGVYFMIFAKDGQTKVLPLLWKKIWDSSSIRPVSEKELASDNLLKVDFCGLGCVLIHRSVLEKVKFRYLENNKNVFDDIYFCDDTVKQGFSIFADMSVKCKHLFLDKFIKQGVGRY